MDVGLQQQFRYWVEPTYIGSVNEYLCTPETIINTKIQLRPTAQLILTIIRSDRQRCHHNYNHCNQHYLDAGTG